MVGRNIGDSLFQSFNLPGLNPDSVINSH